MPVQESTCRKRLSKSTKIIKSQQIHAIPFNFNKDKFSHTSEIYKDQEILNIYQFNILSNMIFMHLVENKTAPPIILTKFYEPSHTYSTDFPAHNFSVPNLKLKKSGQRISVRGPFFWNKIPKAVEKSQVFGNSGLP